MAEDIVGIVVPLFGCHPVIPVLRDAEKLGCLSSICVIQYFLDFVHIELPLNFKGFHALTSTIERSSSASFVAFLSAATNSLSASSSFLTCLSLRKLRPSAFILESS